MSEPYWLPDNESFSLTVPPDLVLKVGGGTRGPGDTIRFSPPPPDMAADLYYDGLRLGRFTVDSIQGRADLDGTHYRADFRRTEQPPSPIREPLDDDFARWIKAKRDTYAHASMMWGVFDDLLEEYRDHRATGTPLDQELEQH
jgi:hypothetical protein